MAQSQVQAPKQPKNNQNLWPLGPFSLHGWRGFASAMDGSRWAVCLALLRHMGASAVEANLISAFACKPGGFARRNS